MSFVTRPGTLTARLPLVALVGLMAALFGPLATAEIYKCVAKNGLPLYQNFPCDLDSLSLLPSSAQIANATAVDDRDKKAAALARATHKSTHVSEPSVGMTSDEITALMGEPVERIEDEPAEGGRISVWRYADGRSVQFDHRQRVLQIQR